MKILKGEVNGEWASDDAYFANKSALSNSMLGILDESPTKFKLFLDGKWSYPDAPYFTIGTATHEMFLENKDRRIKVEGTRRTNEYKATEKENPQSLVLPATDYNLVDNMVKKLKKVPELSHLMNLGKFVAEAPMVSQVITDQGNFIDIKGKLDGVVQMEDGSSFIIDLKTSGKGLAEWKSKSWYGSYPRQAYMYSEMLGATDFYFCVVVKEFPYDVGIFRASPAFLEKGRKQFERSISEYERLFINGEYKPYSATIDEL